MVETMEDKQGWKSSLFFPHQIINFAFTYFASFILVYFAPT